MTILVACGLKREARIAAGPGVIAIAGGGDAKRLEAMLEAQAPRARAILSGGIAGALDPSLRAGEVVIGLPPSYPSEAQSVTWMETLAALFPHSYRGTILGLDGIAATAAQKAALHTTTGAIAIDMESHVAARVAARHRLPFAILRTIADRAGEDLPPAALIGMRPDGSMAFGAVLAALARRPGQLPALIRTAIGAEAAFGSLRRCHDVLRRRGIGRLDLGELALDM